MAVKPDYLLTFDSLLQKRLFRIPEYQRAYSWENKQRKDLFDDIKNLQHHDIERHHFMATVVCLQTRTKEEIGADEYSVFHIVDGQQRLTTLIVILKALSKRLLNGNSDKKKEANKLNELLVKGDQRLILLQTNHDSSFLFRKYLMEGAIPPLKSASTVAERNLVEAFQECEHFVEDWETNPLSLLKIVKNGLDFIFYVLEDEGAVYRIFEVLNSRGLEVDWLDKCKTMLMGIAFDKFKPEAGREQIEELHKRWTKIYHTIGLQKIPGHEILRFAATFKHEYYQNKIISAEDAVEFFRSHCENNPKDIVTVSDQFVDIAKKLEKLYANPRLRAVTDIIHARLLAVAIMFDDSLNVKEQAEALDCWEAVTFRIFGLGKKDSRSRVRDYTRLAQEIMNKEITNREMAKRIESLADRSKVREAIDDFEGSDCYNDWPNVDLLYFFYRYEEHLAKKAGAAISKEVWALIWSASPASTIEHIYPQNPGPEWRGKLGRGRGQEKHINRLGNLMILPPDINSEAGNKSFEDKKKIYRKNRHLKLMEEVLNKQDWNRAIIEKREKRLLDWARTTWG